MIHGNLSWSGYAAQLSRFILYALILWAPVPFGSNRPLFWATNGLAASVALVLFAAGIAGLPASRARDWRMITWFLGGAGVLLLWMMAQALPVAPAPLAHPAWRLLPADLAAEGSISLHPGGTWAAVARFGTLVAVALIACGLASRRHRTAFLLNLVLMSVTLIALYGLAVQAVGAERILWVEKAAYRGYLTATFVNRNSAATFFAFGIIVAITLFAVRPGDAAGSGRGRGVASLVAGLAGRSGVYLASLVVLSIALLNTGSRAGILAAAVGVVTIGGMVVIRGRRGRSTGLVVLVAGLALAVAIFALAGDALVNRLEREGVDASTRLAVWRDTLALVLERPLLGHGAGAFAMAYPLVHSSDAPSAVVWLQAHNTYLEAAAELGLPAALLAILLLAIGVAVVGRAALRSAAPSPAALTAVGVAAVAAVHSSVDFSLQIQAVALLFAALLGAGLGEAMRNKEDTDRSARAPHLSGPLTRSDDLVEVHVGPAP